MVMPYFIFSKEMISIHKVYTTWNSILNSFGNMFSNSSLGTWTGILWRSSFACSVSGTYNFKEPTWIRKDFHWVDRRQEKLHFQRTSLRGIIIASSNPCSILARTSFIAARASSRQLCGAPSFRISNPNADCQRYKGDRIKQPT